MVAKKIRPIIDLKMEPLPPIRLAPPRMAAVNILNSSPIPVVKITMDKAPKFRFLSPVFKELVFFYISPF